MAAQNYAVGRRLTQPLRLRSCLRCRRMPMDNALGDAGVCGVWAALPRVHILALPASQPLLSAGEGLHFLPNLPVCFARAVPTGPRLQPHTTPAQNGAPAARRRTSATLSTAPQRCSCCCPPPGSSASGWQHPWRRPCMRWLTGRWRGRWWCGSAPGSSPPPTTPPRCSCTCCRAWLCKCLVGFLKGVGSSC
jgi:hypothetical protein